MVNVLSSQRAKSILLKLSDDQLLELAFNLDNLFLIKKILSNYERKEVEIRALLSLVDQVNDNKSLLKLFYSLYELNVIDYFETILSKIINSIDTIDKYIDTTKLIKKVSEKYYKQFNENFDELKFSRILKFLKGISFCDYAIIIDELPQNKRTQFSVAFVKSLVYATKSSYSFRDKMDNFKNFDDNQNLLMLMDRYLSLIKRNRKLYGFLENIKDFNNIEKGLSIFSDKKFYLDDFLNKLSEYIKNEKFVFLKHDFDVMKKISDRQKESEIKIESTIYNLMPDDLENTEKYNYQEAVLELTSINIACLGNKPFGNDHSYSKQQFLNTTMQIKNEEEIKIKNDGDITLAFGHKQHLFNFIDIRSNIYQSNIDIVLIFVDDIFILENKKTLIDKTNDDFLLNDNVKIICCGSNTEVLTKAFKEYNWSIICVDETQFSSNLQITRKIHDVLIQEVSSLLLAENNQKLNTVSTNEEVKSLSIN